MSAAKRPVIIPVLPLCFILSIIIFSSCVDKVKTDIIAFEALDEGLVNSNMTINKSSESLYASLEQKTTEAATSEKAKLWLPKAMLIQKLSSDAYKYIEELKMNLKKEAGLKAGEDPTSFRESDKNSVMRLFEKKKKGEELYDRLKNYKKEMLATDPEIAKEFGERIILTTTSFDSPENKHQDLWRTFFDDLPTAAALAVLSKFQNNIRIAENKTLAYFRNKITYHGDFDMYSAFAMANSNYVKAKEEIEITAGIGAFSSLAKPEIVVEGRSIPVGADGAAHYKFKASDKPGKHVVPIEISFLDQEGKKQTITKNIEYTVAQ